MLDFLYYLAVCLFNLLITLPRSIYYICRKAIYLENLCPPDKIPKLGVHDWVVLVPGHNGIPQEFDSMAKAIKKKHPELQILCIDFGSNRNTSVHVQVEAMHKFLEEYQPIIRSMKLVGMSMGGVVAMFYAKKYPEKIASVITISSPVRGTKVATYNPLYSVVRKELGYHSDDLKPLLEVPSSYPVYHIVPHWDHVIRPMDCAKTPYGITYYYKGFNSHSGVAEAADVIDKVIQWLT